jgi:hypothetical protein
MKQLKFYNEFRNHNRKIIREQIKEIKKSGFTPEVDLLFKEQCDLFISGGITIYQFDSYLEKDLGLNEVNESFFDWSKKVAVKFFQRVFNKVKIFFSTIFSKIKENRDKIMEMLCVIVDKIMSGLKKFGKWIKENKKGLHTLMVKIIVSLSISAVVSYILSMFGTGWVAAMGVKMGTSAVSKKVGGSVASAVTKEKKLNYLKTYQKVFESMKDNLLKIGSGLKKFFDVLKKFKIAMLIFFGVVFILNLMFDPMFDPILEIAGMTKLSDVFSNSFAIPTPDKISKIDIDDIKSSSIKTDVNIKLDLGETGKEYIENADETNSELIKNIKLSVNDVSKNITEDPELAKKNIANIVNQLHEEIQNSEPANIEDVSAKDANDLDNETVNKDIQDMGDVKNPDITDADVSDVINIDSPEVRKNIQNLITNNLSSLIDKDAKNFLDKDGYITVDGTYKPVEIGDYKVEYDYGEFNIKDGQISEIKRLILLVTDKDGNEIHITTSPGGDKTTMYSTSLKQADGYEEMTYKEFEARGLGVRADVKDISEKSWKKVWVKSYNQQDLSELAKKIAIKGNEITDEVQVKWDSFDNLKAKLGLERDDAMSLGDSLDKIGKMTPDILKQKYTELIGGDDTNLDNMKLALLKYKIDNPSKSL